MGYKEMITLEVTRYGTLNLYLQGSLKFWHFVVPSVTIVVHYCNKSLLVGITEIHRHGGDVGWQISKVAAI